MSLCVKKRTFYFSKATLSSAETAVELSKGDNETIGRHASRKEIQSWGETRARSCGAAQVLKKEYTGPVRRPCKEEAEGYRRGLDNWMPCSRRGPAPDPSVIIKSLLLSIIKQNEDVLG